MSEYSKGILALVLLAWTTVTMGVFAKYLGGSLELFVQAYLRIAMAFIFALLFFHKKVDFTKYTHIPLKDMVVLIIRIVGLFGGIVLVTKALLMTKYANVTLISTIPLLPFFGYVILGETLTFRSFFWIIIGFLGAIIIIFQPGLTLGLGEFYALLSFTMMGLSNTLRKKQSHYLNNYETTVIMFFLGTILLFLTSVGIGETQVIISDFTIVILLAIIFSGLFNVANLFLTNYGFSKIKVAIAGNILTLKIVFSVLYGISLYHEIPDTREVIGGLFIVLSVFMVNRLENIKEPI